MDFVAIDVETANADLGSICQIGIATFKKGNIQKEWSTLVDPEDYFDDMNISIHGIEPKMVRGKPKFPDVVETIRNFLIDTVSVCHTAFDRVALSRVCIKYAVPPISTSWLDSARVVRRTWKDLAWKGYGLGNVCRRIGYDFKAHDALEDAKAAGYVLLAALRESGLDLEACRHRVCQPIDPARSSSGAAIHRDGNPEGDLFGEVIVFTGALEIHRNEAADLAASIGCEVGVSVNNRTTILVVGDQDIKRLAGHEKSAKHRKTEHLIVEGHPIRILRETDFKALVDGAQHAAEPSVRTRSLVMNTTLRTDSQPGVDGVL